MATTKKQKTAAPKRKAPTPKKPPEVAAPTKVKAAKPEKATKLKVTAPMKGVSAVRAAMTQLLVREPGIPTEELGKKLSAAGHQLTDATLRTMAYHASATIRALAEAGLLNVPSSSSE
jgi:hypothetical protein